MYSTCLFCHASLGANEVIERFPVGRRLAFDAAKGRLWVVCGKCAGWNLTPLEERWEAIEECERRFRGTILRASTDHIGMTRLAEGLELIRIGDPLRPELATWRYGSRLIRRRWRSAGLMTAGVVVIGVELAVVHSLAVAGISGAAWLNVQTALTHYWTRVRTAVRVPGADGKPIDVTISQVLSVDIEPDGDESGWALIIPRKSYNRFRHRPSIARLTGSDALRAAGLILPRINPWGATRSNIVNASALLQEHGVGRLYRDAAKRAARFRAATPSALQRNRPLSLLEEHEGKQLMATARETRGFGQKFVSAVTGPDRHMHVFSPVWRLALEIGAHEDTERRAMEGELTELEAAWREAEEIAAIADNMFLPQFVTEFMHRRRDARLPTTG